MHPARWRTLRALKWAGIAFAVVLVAAVAFLATFDWNRARPWVERVASERTGLVVRIAGDLRVRAFSRHPQVTLERLSVDNPRWAERRRVLALERGTAQVDLLPLLVGRVVVERLELERPRIDVYVAADGRANWQAGRPAQRGGDPDRAPALPLVRRFLVNAGELHVDDLKHRLRLHGIVVAGERSAERGAQPFRIAAQGTLNREPFALRAYGGPLVNLDPDEPYTFDTEITAGRTQVAARTTIAKPFDLARLTTTATMSGEDLADLYFLTGVALPNSRPYGLAVRIERQGARVLVRRLDGRIGGSDLTGHATLDLRGERPRLEADLVSRSLDLGDLAAPLGVGFGADARGGSGAVEGGAKRGRDADRKDGGGIAGPDGRVLPDAVLQLERVRALDAHVRYRAQAVAARRVPFRDVHFELALDDGVLSLQPVAFRFEPGALEGTVRIDASGRVPLTSVDLRVGGVELGKVRFRKPQPGAPAGPSAEPPIEGTLRGRMQLRGAGASVREFASNADGSLTFVVPRGKVNQAFAQLTGIQVARGLGLLVTDPDEQTNLRCGVADFRVRDGTIEARSIVFDTSVVRITGEGSVNLDRESLDLAIRGHPKKASLMRVRTPIEIEGTLADPSLGIDAGDAAKQGAIATALGVLLTPLASVLAFVDPGLAKDADCAALLRDARARGAPARTRTAEGPGGRAK